MSDFAQLLNKLAVERDMGVLRANALKARNGKSLGLLLTLAPLAACSTNNGGLGEALSGGLPTGGGTTPTPTGSTTTGTPGNDTIDRRSSTTDENIDGLDGTDVILTGSGNDRISGGPGNDQIAGGAGNDIIFGNEGIDDLSGGFGNDIIIGGPGRDTMDGGSGNDIFILIGTTAAGEYDLSDLTNSGGTGLDLSDILSLSDLNGRTVSDAVLGEKIDGGGGFDTLVIYGDVDLTGLDLQFIDQVIVNSTLTISAADLKALGSMVGNGASRLVITDGGAGPVTVNITDTPISGFRDVTLGDNVTFVIADSTQIDGALIGFSGTGTVKLQATDIQSDTSPVAALMLDQRLGLVDANGDPVDFQLAAVTLFDGASETMGEPQVVVLGAGDIGTISGLDTIFEVVGDNATINGTGSPQSFNAIRWTPQSGDTLTVQGATAFERIFVDTTLSGDAVSYDGQTLTIGTATIVIGLNVPFAVADVAGGLHIAFDDGLNHAPTGIALDNNSVNENDDGEPIVGLLSATDQDPTESLSFTLDSSENRFEIVNGNELKLTAGTEFNHEALTNGQTQLDVKVTDKAGETFSETLTIVVNDVNEAPTDISLDNASVNENTAGAVIGQLSAADVDAQGELFGQHTFSTNDARFDISPTGQLSLASGVSLDFEAANTVQVEVTARDNNNTGLSFTETLTITVNDINDAPVFTSPNAVSVAENETAVMTVEISDEDVPADPRQFGIVGGDDGFLFFINPNTGELSFNAAPDFEAPIDLDTSNDYEVTVSINDGGTTVTQDIVVAVTGVNEAPFINTVILGQFERTENEVSLFAVAATDPENDNITFGIANSGDASAFTINAGGVLKFVSAPDFENPTDGDGDNVYTVEVTASDNEFTTSRVYNIRVTDANDAPVFTSPGTATVAEGQTFVQTPTASDQDVGDNVQISVVGGTDGNLFEVNANGDLVFKAAPDFENYLGGGQDNQYHVLLQASDTKVGKISSVFVTVTDENEAPTAVNLSNTNVAENSAGTVIGALTVSDPDSANTSFGQHGFIVNDNRFEVNELNELKLKQGITLDFETEPTVSVNVTATDGGELSTNTTFMIAVTDANDPVSIASFTSSGVDENAVGVVIGQINIEDEDLANGSFGSYIFSTPDPRLTISETGEVRLKSAASLDFEEDTPFSIELTVEDNSGNAGSTTDTRTFTVTINDLNDAPHNIALSNSEVNEGQSGAFIGNLSAIDQDGDSFEFFLGSPGPFELNGTALSLIAGVALDHESLQDGEIDVVILARDSEGAEGHQTLTISVLDVNEAPTGMALSANTIDENDAGGIVGQLTVSDPDDPASDFGTYDFTVNDDRFEVNDQGQLKLKEGESLDYEAIAPGGGAAMLPLTITGTDNSATPFSIFQSFNIQVNNVNDAPENIRFSVDGNLDENVDDSYVGIVTANDQETPGSITFSLDASETRFELVGNNQLRVKAGVTFDHEESDTVEVDIIATDGDTVNPGVTRTTLTVEIDDVNEAPTSLLTAGTPTISENVAGDVVFALAVNDPDDLNDPFGQHSFEITNPSNGQVDDRFEIVAFDEPIQASAGLLTHQLKLKDDASIDFEVDGQFIDLQIDVTDMNGAGLSIAPPIQITVTVQDQNDAPHSFALSNASVDENDPSAEIGTLSAMDQDGDMPFFSTSDGRFVINGNTLSLAQGVVLDHEENDGGVTTVVISANDGKQNGVTSEELTITINDVNEAPTAVALDNNKVVENVEGAVVGTLTASDPDDATQPFGQHSFVVNDERFEVNANGELKLKDDESLDFEVDGTFFVLVQAIDNPGGTGPHLSFTQSIEIETVDRFESVDVAEMESHQGLVLAGFDYLGRTGFSVAGIGDIDGDGIADVAVGSPTANEYARGFTHVVYGSAIQGQEGSVFDLDDLLAEDGFSIINNGFFDYDSGEGRDFVYHGVGYSVAAAGDINGDGFADLIIGAPGVYDDFGDYGPGRSYVVFGGADGFGAIDEDGRATIDLYDGATFSGFSFKAGSDDAIGYSVSGAGDVNGDGFDDLIIGLPYAGYNAKSQGHAMVLFGRASLDSPYSGKNAAKVRELDPYDLSYGGGFIIRGAGGYDNLGLSVSSAGDINGDGLDDLIVGAQNAYGDGVKSGDAYVIFGGATPTDTQDVDGFSSVPVFDVSELTADQGFVLQRQEEGSLVGSSVANAGDVNGDGFDDLLIGASESYGGTGAAFIVFGGADGFGTTVEHTSTGALRQIVDLTQMAPEDGVGLLSIATFVGAIVPLEIGSSVSAAGDVNGDGFADVIIGASYGFTGEDSDYGAAYVVFGSDQPIGSAYNGSQYVFLENVEGLGIGTAIYGPHEDSHLGGAVSGAGDVNGDGFDDLIVGAHYAYDVGEAYIIYGGRTGLDAEGKVIQGNDGANILIGDAAGDMLFGGGGADIIRGGAGDDYLQITGFGGEGHFHFKQVDGGTGFDTLGLIGGGSPVFDFADLAPNAVRSIEAIAMRSTDMTITISELDVYNATEVRQDGVAVLRINGNGNDAVNLIGNDWVNAGAMLIEGVPYQRWVSNNAELQINDLIDVRTAFVDLETLGADQGFIIAGEDAFDDAGRSVSNAGDVNGDGFDDLLVGARFAGDDDAGAAYVVFGSANGFGVPVDNYGVSRQVLDLAAMTGAEGFILAGGAADEYAGSAVSSAGDLNGDGFADLLIGANGHYSAGKEVGRVHIFYGKAGGFGSAVTNGEGVEQQVVDLAALAPNEGTAIEGVEDNGRDTVLGDDVAAAGDVNGDGFGDFLIGTDGDEKVYLVFGQADPLALTDVEALEDGQGVVLREKGFEDLDVGEAISSAGDVNGDGYADIIIGAPDAQDDRGEAYVLFGSSDPIGELATDDGVDRRVVNLDDLGADEGFIIRGSIEGTQTGYAVASAGDVNGDGIDDIIVANQDAHYSSDGRGSIEAYVVFGQANGIFGTEVVEDGITKRVVDTGTLTSANGFVVRTAQADYSGLYDVSSAGDVNGDGFDDLLLGVYSGDSTGHIYTYSAFVVFGSGDGFGEREGGRNVVDLTRLTGDVGFEIASNTYDDFAESVSAAGDINGDGYDDLIIGADDGDIGGNNAGQAYVIFGQQFGSEPTTDTLFGTAAGERLNPIVSNAEVVKAGAGDDEIEATLAYFNSLAMVIDGGSGFDRLVTKFGDTFNFNDMEPLIEDIEALDMRGGDDNTLRVFDPLDVLNASSTSNQLVIFGDTSDTLEISTAFTAGTTGITGREGLTFNLYESGEASLLVQIGVDVDVLV